TACDGKSATDVTGGVCPFVTIEKAIDTAADGDIIRVYENTGSGYSNAVVAPWTWTGKSLSFYFEDGVVLNNAGKGCFLITTNNNRLTSVNPGMAKCQMIAAAGDVIGLEVASGVHDIVVDGLKFQGPGVVGGSTSDGIRFDGSNSNIQVVNSWFGTYVNGIQFIDTPTGVIDIQGNNFEHNTGFGILAPTGSTFSIKYNSWNFSTGPGTLYADKVSGFDAAYYTPWTYAKLSLTEPLGLNKVAKNDSITYTFSTSVQQVLGVDLTITFNKTALEYVSSNVASTAFPVEQILDTSAAASDGIIKFHGVGTGHLPVSLDGQEIMKVTFKGKTVGAYDIKTSVQYAMSQANGPSNWVYDSAFPTPSNISAGEVIQNYKAVTGTISMQGRVARDGAVVKFWQTDVEKFTGTTSNQITNNISVADVLFGSYVVSVVKDGYLDINTTMARSATFSNTAFTINSLELKGGDANDDDAIDVSDATLIGGDYGKTSGFTDFTDINSSGKVDIYDLALMGGNYDATSSDTVVIDNKPAYLAWTAQ
ncbi:MAG: hypothetical protein HGB35_08400, partial [Geobacteraceae bacterium]|nr:hypothetical protein [Geobacteraceae bacterium]